jgi:hypothetical protein
MGGHLCYRQAGEAVNMTESAACRAVLRGVPTTDIRRKSFSGIRHEIGALGYNAELYAAGV